jgi:hypothetical protein
MVVESSLDRWMKPHYLGPMVVMMQNKGRAYIVTELDGSVWHEKIGAIRLVPYFARHEIDLPGGIDGFIDIAKKTLTDLKQSEDTERKHHPDIWLGNVECAAENVNDAESDDNIVEVDA